MTKFPQAKRISLPGRGGRPGIALAVHEQGSGPAVVLCHGFPELAFSWRHQLPALAEAGFRAIAPDQRGYGGSGRPEKVEDYGLMDLTGDLVGLLDALGIEKAVFLGHDWGGVVAWAMPLVHPERTAGVIGLCTPYRSLSTAAIRAAWKGEDAGHYMLWFQQPGVAEAVLDAQVRLCFEKLMRRNFSPAEMMRRTSPSSPFDMNPFRRLTTVESYGEALLSEEELAVYTETFERTGFGGGINWYRNIDRNDELVPGRGERPLTLPCLMITAEWDFALPPRLAEGMPAVCSDLERHMIPRAGHWVQQEFPDEVNRLVIRWLKRRYL
jgi:pimeloyl-ACP methyl ester carboxylesterase